MDWLQFFSSVIQSLASLAWPLAIVVCVLLFREKLLDLLPGLRLKHKDLEISFRLDKAEQEARQLPAPENQVPNPTPEETQRFEQIAQVSPRAAILELRANLDNAVRGLAEAAGIARTNASLMSLIRELRKMNRLDPHTSALLDDLRAVGNVAAHSTLQGRATSQ
jgi:Domain of unknown function (DUF4145)